MSNMPDLPDEVDVKKRQMILVGGLMVLIILILVYVYFTNTANMQQQALEAPPVEVDLTSPGDSADPIQNWVLQNENKLAAYESEQERLRQETERQIQQMMEQIEQLKRENEAMSQALENTRSVGAGTPIPANQAQSRSLPPVPLPPRSSLPVINTPESLSPPPGSAKPQPAADKPGQNGGGVALADRVLLGGNDQARIVKVKFNKKKGKKKRAHIRDTIPAGSFGRAVLLSGVDAPTGGLAERHPIPVLLEMLDNGRLPNKYRHRVKQCRLVGSATGNISDERGYIRLERLTCILKNGEIISEVVTGSAIGEDGKNGLRGKLVSKQGQIIANAFLAGSLSNIGSAVAQSYTTVATTATGTVSTLDPNRVLEAGAAGGMGTTLEKIADWYFKRAEETFPIIEINAGRIIDVFLTEDVELGANLLSNYTPENAHE